jgi:basic membrane protein A and related proteins
VKKRLLPWATMALAAVALVAVAAVSARTNAPASPKAKSGGSSFRVAMVTDIGGLNDRSFNQLANTGLKRADRQLSGVSTRVFDTKSAAERVPNLLAAARGDFDLIIAVGFLNFEALNTVAKSFSNKKFAGIDIPYAVLSDKPTNGRGLVFKEQEAGYLVGYLAGLTIKRHPYKGRQIVSAVGANNVPAIVRFMAGYRAGARKANKRVRVLLDFANDPTFSDQAKCKETALNQISRGSGIVFQVAGGCGLGALSAAKEKKVWGIGVDADQYYLGKHMLTSATKKVDVAMYQTIQEARRVGVNRFRTGIDKVFNVKSGAVGYGRLSPKVPKADRVKLEKLRRQIAAGKIKIPTAIS